MILSLAARRLAHHHPHTSMNGQYEKKAGGPVRSHFKENQTILLPLLMVVSVDVRTVRRACGAMHKRRNYERQRFQSNGCRGRFQQTRTNLRKKKLLSTGITAKRGVETTTISNPPVSLIRKQPSLHSPHTSSTKGTN